MRLEDLTAEEQHEAVSTGKAPDTMYDSVMPYLFWTCEALGEYFHERLHWASSDREASAQQLVRIVEGWLVGCRSRRTHRADLDEVLKRHGL